MTKFPSAEGQHLDRKSLRTVTGKSANFYELAKDCVCFANGPGGQLHIGIEDNDVHPPADQRIDPELIDHIRKRIGELTVNVQVLPEVRQDDNGGGYIVISIPRSTGVASTSDGRYLLRVGDTCSPVVGDDVMRLINERPALLWETMTSLGVLRSDADASKLAAWITGIRGSERVKASVKEKTDDELLEHYDLANGDVLTNLGILLTGTTAERLKLGTAPVVQAIKYDEREEKISKHVWDDYSLSPIELVDAIWKQIPDFRETYELPEGMFRTTVPAFDEVVIRELLVNALVHRPYTQRGDIFLNLHPDRLEIVSPGRLPLGVTPQDILHSSQRRNNGLARVFHDLKLMEREGSGFDLMYDRLLASGRGAPVATEKVDSVHVVVQRRILYPGAIRLFADADQKHDLTQRERIALGMLAQTEGLTATDLAEQLELPNAADLTSWITRLIELGLVQQTGRTKAARYFVPPELLRNADLNDQTNLKRIEPRRLHTLILEDVANYSDLASSDIHRRVGPEIPDRTFRRALQYLVNKGRLTAVGERRWRRYHLSDPIGQGEDNGQ